MSVVVLRSGQAYEEPLPAGEAAEPAPERSRQLAFTEITPIRRLTPAAAERHSQLVRTLRLAVPALAAGLLITYALNAAPEPVDREFLRQFSDVGEPGREMVLERPRYVAEGSDGSPFAVSARAARRNPDEPNLVRFDDPEALRGEGAEGAARLRAGRGVLDTDTNLFDGEDVSLVQNIGGQDFTLTTDAAQLDIATKAIRSRGSVSGSSESSRLEADGLQVLDDGERFRLDGRVKLRLEPGKMPKDER